MKTETVDKTLDVVIAVWVYVSTLTAIIAIFYGQGG